MMDSNVFYQRLKELYAAKRGLKKQGPSPWTDPADTAEIEKIGREMAMGGGTGIDYELDPEILFMRRYAGIGPDELRSGHRAVGSASRGMWQGITDSVGAISDRTREINDILAELYK